MPLGDHEIFEDEDEVVAAKKIGPAYVTLKSKQGRGFVNDYEKVETYLGPGKIPIGKFEKDIARINEEYEPVALRTHKFLKTGTYLILSSLSIFIVLGIIGGRKEVRNFIVSLFSSTFLLGVLFFFYSKWIEQPAIKEGAMIVKKVLDEVINPQYDNDPNGLYWSVGVRKRPQRTIHMGQTFVERPILYIFALKSKDENGNTVNWPKPEMHEDDLHFNGKVVS